MAKVWEWSQTEGTSLLVLLALADHADDDGFCYPGVERIARKCRISARTVQRHIEDIRGLGELLVDVGRGITVQGGATNRYRITVQKGGDSLTGGDKPAGEVVTNGAKSGDKAMSPKPPVEPPVREPSFPLDPLAGAGGSSIKTKCDLSEGFAEFWTAYPKKEKKDKALAAWKRKRCATIQGEIMLALAMHKTTHKWTKKGGQFIPYPATWLNGGEWQNEIIETAPATKEKTGF